MAFSNFTVLIYLLALASFFMLAGRLVTARQREYLEFTNPLQCLMCGMGLWYLWFLVFAGLLATNITVVWWLFVSFSFMAMLFFTRSIKGTESHSHVWSNTLVSLCVLGPILWWASYDIPLEITEFSQTIKNAAHLHAARILPGGQDVELFNITNPQHPIAHLVGMIPAHLISSHFLPAAFAVFNVLLLVLCAGQLLQVHKIPVKWSNMPLVAAGSLLGVSLLNPFFRAESLLAAVPTFPLAAALLAACFPLFRAQPLPTGWGALPSALALCFMVGLHPQAAWLVGVVVVFWLLRMAAEKPKIKIKTMFGPFLLAFLPALTWLMWQSYLTQAQIPVQEAVASVGTSYKIIHFFLSLWKVSLSAPLALVLVLAVVLFAIRAVFSVRSTQGARALFVQKAHLVLPAVLGLFWLGVAATNLWQHANMLFNHLAVLQMVFLVPLWRLFLVWYAASDMKKLFWRMPWAMGMLLVCTLVVLQMAVETKFRPTFNPPLNHTLQVAQALKKGGIPWGSRIAVVDSLQVRDKYAHALSYGLANHAVVHAITPWVAAAKGNRAAFHAALRAQNFDYLWVHVPNDQTRKLLSQRLNATESYLFQISAEKFQLKNTYPHPTYEVPY